MDFLVLKTDYFLKIKKNCGIKKMNLSIYLFTLFPRNSLLAGKNQRVLFCPMTKKCYSVLICASLFCKKARENGLLKNENSSPMVCHPLREMTYISNILTKMTEPTSLWDAERSLSGRLSSGSLPWSRGSPTIQAPWPSFLRAYSS